MLAGGQGHADCTMAGSQPYRDSQRLAALVNQVGDVIAEALAPKTRDSYNRVFQEYRGFVHSLGLSNILLLNPGVVVLYLSHLFQKGIASNTLFSIASSLSYVFKFQGGQIVTLSYRLCY